MTSVCLVSLFQVVDVSEITADMILVMDPARSGTGRPRICADFSAMAGKNVVDQFELFLGLGHLLLLFQVLSQTRDPSRASPSGLLRSLRRCPPSASLASDVNWTLVLAKMHQGSQQAPLGPPLPPAGRDPYCRQSTLSIALVNRHPPC